MKIGEIVSYTGLFQIARNLVGDSSSVYANYNPTREKDTWLYKGDALKVPYNVTVIVKCDHNDTELKISNEREWIVGKYCHPATSRSANFFTATPLITPEKLVIARIAIPPSNTNFEISRDPDTNFHSFRVDWDTSLYEGDRLKVPQGQNVWVICQHNGEKVRVPSNDRPWAVTMACPSR